MASGLTKIIKHLFIFQSIKTFRIEDNKIDSIIGSPFTVLITDDSVFVYGYHAKKEIMHRGRSFFQYITDSEMKVYGDGHITENGIARRDFIPPSSVFVLPENHSFSLESLTVIGNTNITKVSPSVINQKVCPFRLIMGKGALLSTGISVNHLECKIEDNSSIMAFKYHGEIACRWNLETFLLYYGKSCSVNGLYVAARLEINVVDEVYPINSQADIKIKHICSFVSPNSVVLRNLPSFIVTRESNDSQQGVLLMRNAHAHKGLEARIQKITDERDQLQRQQLATQITRVMDGSANTSESSSSSSSSQPPPLLPPTRQRSMLPNYNMEVLHEIVYLTPPNAAGTRVKKTMVAATLESVPDNSEVISINYISSKRGNPPVPKRQRQETRNSRPTHIEIESFEEEEESIPQHVLDESREMSDAHSGSGEQLDFTSSLKLDETFKNKNEPFYDLMGNIKLEDTEFDEDSRSRGKKECIICCTNEVKVVYDCGHSVNCIACAETQRYLLDTCTVCKREIKSAIIPFI